MFRATQRLQQVLYEYSFEGLHSLVSVMYCIHGEYVQVVAMPPVIPSTLEPAPSQRTSTNVTSHLCSELEALLNLPLLTVSSSTAPKKKCISLMCGADGRCYIWNGWSLSAGTVSALLSPNMVHSTTSSSFVPGSDLVEAYLLHLTQTNPEVLARTLSGVVLSSSTTSSSSSSSPLPSLHEYITSILFPIVVERFLELFEKRDKPSKSTAAVIKDQILLQAMRSCHVPCKYLYLLFDYGKKWLNQAKLKQETSTAQLNFEEGDDEAIQDGKKLLSSADNNASSSSWDPKAVKVLCDVCQTEMAGRALKDMVMFDLRSQAAKGFISEQDQLEVVNRVLRYFSTKDSEFWSGALTDCVKRKFCCFSSIGGGGGGFVVEPTRVHIASVLKMVSSRTGAILIPDRNRFEKYASVRDTGIFSVTHADTLWCTREQDNGLMPLVESYAKLTKSNERFQIAAMTEGSTSNTLAAQASLLYNAWEVRNCLVCCHSSYLLTFSEANAQLDAINITQNTSNKKNDDVVMRMLNAAFSSQNARTTDASSSSPLHAFQRRRCARLLSQAHLLSVGNSIDEGKLRESLAWFHRPTSQPTSKILLSAPVISDHHHHLRLVMTRATLHSYVTHRWLAKCSDATAAAISHAFTTIWSDMAAAVSSCQAIATTQQRAGLSMKAAAGPQVVILFSLHDAFHRALDSSSKFSLSEWVSLTNALLEFVSLCTVQRNTTRLSTELLQKLMGILLSNNNNSTQIFSGHAAPQTTAATASRTANEEAATAENVESDATTCAPDALRVRKDLFQAITVLLGSIRSRKGVRNVNSVMMTYALGYVALQYLHGSLAQCSSSNSSSGSDDDDFVNMPIFKTVSAGANAIRKILDKTLPLNPKQQQNSATTAIPNSVLYKVSVILQRVAALPKENLTALVSSSPSAAAPESQGPSTATHDMIISAFGTSGTLLFQHVIAFAPTLVSAYALQRVGRGFTARCVAQEILKQSRTTHAGPHQATTPATNSSSPIAQPHLLTSAASSPLPPTKRPASQSASRAAVSPGDTASVLGVDVYSPPPTRGAGADGGMFSQEEDLFGLPSGGEAVQHGEDEGQPIASPQIAIEHEALFEVETAARKVAIVGEVEQRVSIHNAAASDRKVISARGLKVRVDFLAEEEATQRLEISTNAAHAMIPSNIKSEVKTLAQLFDEYVAKNRSVSNAIESLISVEEVAARDEVLIAEARGLQFLSSISERSAAEATAMQQTRLGLEREHGNMSPGWERQGRYDSPFAGISSPTRSGSPAFSHASGSTSSPLAHDHDGLPRASSPLSSAIMFVRTRGHLARPTTAGEIPGEEPRMEHAPSICFSDVQPLSTEELDQLIALWDQRRRSHNSATASITTIAEAVEGLGDIALTTSPPGGSQEEIGYFWRWLQAEADALEFFSAQNLKRSSVKFSKKSGAIVNVVPVPRQQLAAEVVRSQESAWHDLVACATDVVRSAFTETVATASGVDSENAATHHQINEEHNCVARLWASRSAARAYLRSLRALYAACYEVLHLPPTQFVVPVAVKFSFAMSITTATFFPMSPAGEDSTASSAPGPITALVEKVLKAIFSASLPSSSTAPLVVVNVFNDSGRCLIIPTSALVDICATFAFDGQNTNGAFHPALGNHIPEAFVFSASDGASDNGDIFTSPSNRRIELSAEQCARSVKQLVAKAGAITPRALVLMAHRHGVPIRHLWKVLECQVLRESTLAPRTLENVWAAAITTLVARALKQLVEVAVNVAVNEEFVVDNDGDAAAAIQAATLVTVTRLLRSFSRSTTMLQTHLAHILSQHFGASMASVNVNLVSVAAVIREVCRSFGLAESEIVVPSSPGVDSSSSPRAAQQQLQESIGVAAFPIMLAATAPRRIGYLARANKGVSSRGAAAAGAAVSSASRIAQLTVRSQECSELVKSIVVLDQQHRGAQRTSSPSEEDIEKHQAILFSVCAKCIFCDAQEASVSTAAIHHIHDLPIGELILFRHLEFVAGNTDKMQICEPETFVGRAIATLMSPTAATSCSSVSCVEQLWLARTTVQWLYDDLASLSTVQSATSVPSAPQWALYRFAIRVIDLESHSSSFPPSAARVEPILEALVLILCRRAAISHSASAASAVSGNSVVSFVLELAQREIGLVSSLVAILANASFLSKQFRATFASKFTCDVVVPTLLWLVVADQPSTICNAYKDLGDAAVWVCSSIMAEHAHSESCAEDDPVIGAVVSAMELLLCPVLFIGAKGGSMTSTASSSHDDGITSSLRQEKDEAEDDDAKQEKKLTVLSLQLQDLLRAWIAFGRSDKMTEGDVFRQGKILGPGVSLEHLVKEHHRAVDYVRTLHRLIVFVLFHSPTPLPSLVAYASLAGGLLLHLPEGPEEPFIAYLPFPEREISLMTTRSLWNTWRFVPTTTTTATAHHYSHLTSRALEEIEFQAEVRIQLHETLSHNVMTAMALQFSGRIDSIRHRDDALGAQEEAERLKSLLEAIAALEAEWTVVADDVAKEAQNALTALFTSCHDTVEFLYEEDRALKRRAETVVAEFQRSHSMLVDEESMCWAYLLEDFYDVLRLLDEQAASRDAILDEEDAMWCRGILDVFEDDKEWMIHINTSMSPERGVPRISGAMPPASDNHSTWSEVAEPINDDGSFRDASSPHPRAFSRPPTGRREATPRQSSRQSSRQRPVIPASPATGRRPASSQSSIHMPVATSSTAEEYMSADDYGVWQSVAPQQIDETFLSFPPPTAQSPRQESDEDDDEEDEVDLDDDAVAQSQRQEVVERAAVMQQMTSSSGLPPRPSSGSTSSFSNKRGWIDRKKITPPEYYSSDYVEKLRTRSAEWQKHNKKTCGTQTGFTPPPTPPMRSTQQIERIVEGAQEDEPFDGSEDEAEVFQIEPLDILYQSSQSLHFMGEALTVLFFMEFGEQRPSVLKELPGPVFRVPSALSSRRISRPNSSSLKVTKIKVSPLIQAMQEKMRQLEQECASFQVESCAIDECRLRELIDTEQEAVRSRIAQEEDSDKLVIQEQLRSNRSKPLVAAATPRAAEQRVDDDDDVELHQLRVAARAYMKGGAKQLRPPIPATGFSENFMRRAKSSKSKLPPVHNTVSSLLRSLQAELAELEPVVATRKSLLPPLQSASAPLPPLNAAQRVSSAGFRMRPASPGLPHLQKTKLTAATLPPIVASVLPDRDFSRLSLTLPPLTGSQSKPLLTSLGLVTPEVAHSAVEIARLKQEAESEIARETYTRNDDNTARLAFRRPFSAATNPTMPEALPGSLERATQRSHFLIVVQSQLRALNSRSIRCKQAGIKVIHWLRRMVQRIYRRRIALRILHLTTRHERLLSARYLNLLCNCLLQRNQLRAVAHDLITTKVCDTVAKRDFYFHMLRSFRASRRRHRQVTSLADSCRRRTQQSYFEVWYRWLLQTRPATKKTTQINALRSIQHQANNRLQLKYFSRFEALYVQVARRKESGFRLQLLVQEKIRQKVSAEVTRVWCIAMISSGWARKYFKPFFYEMLDRATLKKKQRTIK
ncbi:unnamed protein product [Bodo saltans]|uniref:Uncharacterized protein n=1 Tax=Bodo saltans TaxID=75058 RepID=A0A0S4J1C9_BODSA|nr:unnamed protein product [Bodo saltans]|eukprot:CUG07600.1 unnamed protein product [Bodo saltans]